MERTTKSKYSISIFCKHLKYAKARLGRYSYTGMLEFLFQFLLSLNEFPLLIQLHVRANNFTSILQLSDYLGLLLHSVNNNALHNNNIITHLHCRLHDSENFHLTKTIVVNSMEETFSTLKYTERRNIKLRSVKTLTYSCKKDKR